MTRTLHLIDQLTAADIHAPDPNHVAIHPMTILRDSRMALFEHPDSAIEFKPLRLGDRPHLHFSCGLKQVCWNRMASAVLFRIMVRDREDAARIIFSMEFDPRNRADHRRWRDFDIDLVSLAHEEVTLIFQTTVPAGSAGDYCWAGWADPRIEDEVDAPAAAQRGPSDPLILFITSDALRPDFLGCYGNTEVKTPHLDELARDGALFRHARAQTGSTVGSYAAMLTGRHPLRLDMLSEWAPFPENVQSLPRYLQTRGFHTVIATSEAEVGNPEPGFVQHFDEQIPCLARPAQDGSITTRQFIQWLDQRPAHPCFAWLEYFDTHPPETPPEPYRSMYYDGDPSDPRNVHLPEAIAKIRGMECVQEILLGGPLLESGVIDAHLHARLKASLEFFQGKIAHGPDLAYHLQSLGSRGMGGRETPVFSTWLAEQVHALDEGIIPADLLAWLKELLPQLREIESDILSWLDGVVDYRFPVSQYKGSVSYLDHQVGEIMAALKERGLYDSATIIFTSPHGELFGEHGVYFHHHLLAEAALRIPLIVKAAAGRLRGGARVEGIFDSTDLFPTLLESLDLPVPAGLDGVSRWKDVFEGRAIPAHDSFAADLQEVAHTMVSGDLKLIQAAKPHHISTSWTWKAGERGLFDVSEGGTERPCGPGDHGAKTTQLADRLARWHQAMTADRDPSRAGFISRLKNKWIEPAARDTAKTQHG